MAVVPASSRGGTPDAGSVTAAMLAAGVGGNLLFSSVVAGAAVASIDTGAAGVATGYSILELWLYARTDEAVAASPVNVVLNNDATAIYDNQRMSGANTTASAASAAGGNAWVTNVAGASCGAGVFGLIRITIPAYAGTVGFKVGEMSAGEADTTFANSTFSGRVVSYRSTTAISRVAVAPATGGAKLVIGSALYIFGR